MNSFGTMLALNNLSVCSTLLIQLFINYNCNFNVSLKNATEN